MLIFYYQDLKIIAIAKAPGTADTPRAHLVNPFGMGKSFGAIYENAS
jgi:hypothetical protein